jgi:hypothetical protein
MLRREVIFDICFGCFAGKDEASAIGGIPLDEKGDDASFGVREGGRPELKNGWRLELEPFAGSLHKSRLAAMT